MLLSITPARFERYILYTYGNIMYKLCVYQTYIGYTSVIIITGGAVYLLLVLLYTDCSGYIFIYIPFELKSVSFCPERDQFCFVYIYIYSVASDTYYYVRRRLEALKERP